MIMSWLDRTALLIGDDAVNQLKNSKVAIVGLGGVGGSAAEAVCRMGVGTLILVDNDTVDDTNRNRQLFATAETVGMDKVDAALQRLRALNPEANFIVKKEFYLPENSDFLFDLQPDLVLDAIDTVTGKLALVTAAKAANTPIICAMGAGNKLDPTAFRVADIYETSVCPLARIMRKECRKRGIDKLKVVYSEEDPIPCTLPPDDPAWAELPEGRNALPGSVCFVPAVAGMILAGEVIKDLTKIR